ncbi:MAG: PH domain-containing protein [Anaerolineae bacterium]|nr:PH domain-containing protein [Anaerolineae bacterium]
MAKHVKQETFEPEAVIYYQGDRGCQYYAVVEGALRMTHIDTEGRTHDSDPLGPGTAFGETSLFLGDTRDVTVKAVVKSTLLYIEQEDFNTFLKEYPNAERLLKMREDVKERRAYPKLNWFGEGELPVKILRKHWAILLTNLMLPAAIVIVLFVTSFVGSMYYDVWLLYVGAVLMVPLLLVCAYLYIDWHDDVYVVTNKRVSHQERIGLIKQRRSAAPLHAIQNIAQISPSPVAKLLGFGDLIMEMTGEGGQVIFRSVPDPARIQEIVADQTYRMQAGARAHEIAAIRQVMHRHFLLGERGSAAPDGGGSTISTEESSRRGCLTALASVYRLLLPPVWDREGDTITWRKHWVALLQATILPLFLFTLITALMVVIAFWGEGIKAQFNLSEAFDPQELLGSLLFPYALAIFILTPWLLWQFEDWQNDFYRVTAANLIHVERTPFYLREERRESPLDRITNVRFEQSVMGRILRYGDVFVETAALGGDFKLRFVGRPQDVQKEIFSHMNAYRSTLQERDAERRRLELLDWFSVYDEIRKGGQRPPESEESGS